MIVLGITEISKTKVRILLDNEISFSLYKGELRTYQLREQGDVSEETYSAIMSVLEKRAKLRCMNLLKSRDYTEHQLTAKLYENGYPDSIAEKAIAYVKSYGYVNDSRYAQEYVASASKTKSRKQIETDLMRKGVKKEFIEDAFAVFDAQEDEDTEEELIRKYLRKKHYENGNATYDERRKIIGFLYRKGFSLDKIYKVVGEIE